MFWEKNQPTNQPPKKPHKKPQQQQQQNKNKEKTHQKPPPLKKNHLFVSAGRDSMYLLLMCSSTHYPAAESASACKHRRCVCVWSSLECIAAEQKAGKCLWMAVPVMTCQHWQPGLWRWRRIMGVSAALRVSRMLGAWKLEGCPIPGSPGVCFSPLGPCNWHSAVCRIWLLLAGEEKTPHLCSIFVYAKSLLENWWNENGHTCPSA